VIGKARLAADLRRWPQIRKRTFNAETLRRGEKPEEIGGSERQDSPQITQMAADQEKDIQRGDAEARRKPEEIG
jgi:hypothetical protein